MSHSGVNVAPTRKWIITGSEFAAKRYGEVLTDYARQ
mgnify:CR=1 FL=1